VLNRPWTAVSGLHEYADVDEVLRDMIAATRRVMNASLDKIVNASLIL